MDYNIDMIRKIFKTGHSAAVTISKSLLKDMGLKVGDAVRIEASSGREEIIIRHGKKENQLALGLKLRPKLK
jgi:antitoxin component of MazEF toxin-antitoxin module